ncbi:MAG: hypothetical protein OSJ54_06025 [Oscillospiraceae bacterium]|nr:hypothetical protein [Oscillospiraceae bacterium]
MKNEMINVLVNEVLNTTSEFAQDIEETVAKLNEETAELIALIAYLNGTDSEMENELKEELVEAIANLPTEQRFELDELIGMIAYAKA